MSNSFEGQIHGRLVWPARGNRGFGYDPMFLPHGRSQTFGEMDPVGKASDQPSRRGVPATRRSLPDAVSGTRDDGGFGIYLHWPFCRSKCPYCDFNSHVREAVDQQRWRNALLAELDHYAALAPGRQVESIFFGGGTPSLMPPATVAALIERAARHWDLPGDIEITLEANPTSVEAANFAELAKAGVNRVSLGVQALDDAALRFLGRGHNAAEALAALDVARRQFQRFSFDLIYARPGRHLENGKMNWPGRLASRTSISRSTN